MKIDTTQIPNFDALPDDAKAAISAMEFAPDMSKYVEKSVFDKKASEASELSKQLKARMNDDEKTAAEREAKWAEMEEKLKQLEQEKQESMYKANYLALGYDDRLAEDTARAMVAGDMAKVFENQKKANEAAEKRFRAQSMDNTPKPRGGSGEEKKEVSRAAQIAAQYHQNLYGISKGV